ncbi:MULTISPECIES: hypothetical protein [Streptomyces]|uniref:Uncharacterized protein n=1 Tax=Streptomyces venezuelae TaxID=54571 RepID=A0A5P2BCJ5_STRVZ|nr:MULTISPECIES: hypothetical protein [Streptomyces]NEA05374.1 hypothetical protein [Streptomyces sp. SID10116]MYY81201.1 hypothetical protein [Streptomyces sp. SID335]MYZ16000.1 hypothetical protein [Streptomyces sp. SID337]NDZ90598.1 hypothetical protein [Streptomyces sp. SID10115]NEB48639.1 hypothetical protein [Streptomyces sp. SID339]
MAEPSTPAPGKGAATPDPTVVKWFKDFTERELVKKVELNALKSEMNGGAFAANGISGELTGIKLEKTIWDPLQDLENKKAEGLGELPSQLKAAAGKAQTTADRAETKATGADRRITDLSRELNRKIARKADLSDLRSTASRHDSQLEGLRSSQVNALNREARQARVSVQALEDEIARLNARF